MVTLLFYNIESQKKGPLSKGQLIRMRSSFSQNANQKLQGFLLYHTNKDRGTFFGDFLVRVGRFFGYNPCLFGWAEILVILGVHFWRNDDLINSF